MVVGESDYPGGHGGVHAPVGLFQVPDGLFHAPGGVFHAPVGVFHVLLAHLSLDVLALVFSLWQALLVLLSVGGVFFDVLAQGVVHVPLDFARLLLDHLDLPPHPQIWP
jgi:hypothetical protein